MTIHPNRFPGESSEYRHARDRLLEAEIALRAQIESVAALRRQLPPGGAVAHDYVFDEGSTDGADTETVRHVRFSELFAEGKDTLIVYSFMYGPTMEKACPSCTSVLDSMDGAVNHVTQRTNLVVVARSPIQRIRAHARERGWRNLRMLSSANNDYNADYHAETSDGRQYPILNVFTRRDGVIRHFWATELLFAEKAPGQDWRHVDIVWPLWALLDMTPDGRGTDFRPRLSYGT
jgi:predicted dithiol-disulfide oxidoreductase (DUF899 family)